MDITLNDHGFDWGPMTVRRAFTTQKGSVILQILSKEDAEKEIFTNILYVCITKDGRIRIHRPGGRYHFEKRRKR